MTDTESKPEDEVADVSQGNNTLPYGEALLQAVKELSGHPPLILAVAIGILLVAVAAFGPASSRDTVFALLALFVLGIIAWLATEARRIRQPNRRGISAKGGDVRLGWFSKVGKKAKVTGGGVRISGVDQGKLEKVTGGKVVGGIGATIDDSGELSGGDAEIKLATPDRSEQE